MFIVVRGKSSLRPLPRHRICGAAQLVEGKRSLLHRLYNKIEHQLVAARAYNRRQGALNEGKLAQYWRAMILMIATG